ncbi:transaldolase family protein [Actinomyces sp. B33]|uniref:transaldolase family protein n=1 Tax=Actinomyces sp. B33 TaxID=2942131 RepID=UPI0023402CFB|nr:transaldolase family protein [Actinomyces sp. B33]MDC4232473.1 transaldolase family protein [Actinomyces sp. B33]
MKENNEFLRWMTSTTDSVYWHDSAIIDELEIALGNGAKGVTTNPFLVASTLAARPDYWAPLIADVPADLEGTEKVEELVKRVTLHVKEALDPVHDEADVRTGRCCAQTNPNKTGDYEAVLAQAERYAQWDPRVCLKVPATKSGIRAAEELSAKGYNVVVTVSFTVPQVLATGAALQRGIERARAAGIEPGLNVAVLMVGRLDDYLRDVAQDSSDVVTESDIIQAGTACIKRAYSIFAERGYEAYLMPAGCRGAYHITELAGATMIMSIAPKIADALGELEGPFEERIDVPVDEDVIDRLMTMPEFRKAYEVDGMTPEEFITFGSTNRTTDQFINDGWAPLLAATIG